MDQNAPGTEDPTQPVDTTTENPSSPTPRKRPRTKAAYPRKRAVQACRTCRLRRTKCDNEQPACSSCVGMGIECIYQAGDPSTFDPASLAILQKLDSLERLFLAKSAVAETPESMSMSMNGVASGMKDLGSPSLERTTDTQACYINIESVLSWPIFDDQNFDKSLDLKSLLQTEHGYPQTLMSVDTDFDTRETNKLLQRFLDNVHIFNPVLEESKVREYLRHSSFNGLGWDAQSCLLLLIYAIGSITCPYQRSSTLISLTWDFRQSAEYRQADSFFFAAQKRMGMLLCRSGIIEAQCFFLAGVYLMCILRPIEAWKMFVQALACCQGFHDHRRAIDAQHEEEQQLEQSIYWTCFKSELELRLELNVSDKSVWDLTYPAFFPSPPKGLQSKGEAVWFFYLAEIALRRLGNRILNFVYKHNSTGSSSAKIDEAIINFEDQAAAWLNSLPAALQLDDGENENAALKFILKGHLLDCYEMMYWPFIVDAVHSKPLSTTAEAFTRKALGICVERIKKNESGFYHRHHGTWLMLRSCTRSALVLIAAARAPLISNLLPTDWETAVYKVIEMLKHWKDDSRDVLDRLRIIEQLMK